MLLRSLTVTGFKSFPKRTRLDFPKGIIAIVGPNGCGKSNLIDAIRFVLGEQSPSMLRAKAMEDVLFGGGDKKQCNLAEVSLSLKNPRALSIPGMEDSTEAEITRRLYRSGDSQYLINGKQCRLKDIQYLFMDTGAGARAYSIIDQGQVGNYLEMGPMDRRRLLEEAAGISKYKAKRTDAQRRMDLTNTNLERLKDIMTEVERQLKGLKRQVKKSEEFLTLRKKQERWEKALLAHSWQNAQETALEYMKKEKGLSIDIAGLKAESDSATLRMDGVSLELTEFEQELNVISNSISSKEKDREGLRSQLATMEKTFIKDETELKNMEKSISQLREADSGLSRREVELGREIEDLKGEETLLIKNIETIIKKAKDAEEKRDFIHQAIEGLKVEMVDTSSRFARIEGKRAGLDERLSKLEIRIKNRNDENRKLVSELDALKINSADKMKRAELLKIEMNETEVNLSEITHSQQKMEEERQKNLKEMNRMEIELSRTAARLKLLRSFMEEKFLERCPTAFLESSNIKSHGILADFLEVEAGYEKAVEAALGPFLYAVLVPDLNHLSQAARLFVGHGKGEVAIVHCQGDEKDLDIPEDSIIKHILPKPPIDKVINRILARKKAVNDLNVLSLVTWEEPSNNYYITLSGDILTPWGGLLISRGKGHDEGILQKRTEIKALNHEEQRLKKELEVINIKEAELTRGISENKKTIETLTRKKRALEGELSAETRSVERLESMMENIQERQERLSFECDEMKDEMHMARHELNLMEEEYEVSGTKRDEARIKISAKEEQLIKKEKDLMKIKGKLEESNIQLARIQTQKKNKEQELFHVQRKKGNLKKEEENISRHIHEFSHKLTDMEQSINDIRKRIQSIENEISLKKDSYNDIQKKIDEKRQIYAGLKIKVKAGNERLRAREEELHKIELLTLETSNRLEFLKKTSLERYREDVEGNFLAWLITPFDPEEAKAKVSSLEERINAIGPVNLSAIDEYKELDARWNYLNAQKDDLVQSLDDIRHAVHRIDRISRERFREALDAVNKSLSEVFPILFDGGSAELSLTDEANILESGIDLMVRLPGKRIQHVSLLSGGEKALGALALIFSIYFIKPSPFCLLDEVDAPLDEANTVRYTNLIKRVAEKSQVILVTHNPMIMEMADTLYGVTMEEKGISKMVSVDLA